MDRTLEPHLNEAECHNTHCAAHDVDELLAGERFADPYPYRICGECQHVYHMPRSLIEAYLIMSVEFALRNQELTEGHRVREALNILGKEIDPKSIHACPYCSHDF